MKRGGDRSSRHAWIPWECMWGCMRTKWRYVAILVSLSLPLRPYGRVDTYLNIGYFEFSLIIGFFFSFLVIENCYRSTSRH